MSDPDKAAQQFISLQDICVRAGEQYFFNHTTWNLTSDQRWAIVGPIGAGKSVLAKAIDRSLPLVQGQIRYFFDGPAHPEGRPYLNSHEILTFSSETHRSFLRQFANYHQARWQSFEGQDTPYVAQLLDRQSLFSHSPFEILPPDLEKTYQQQKQTVVDLFDLTSLLTRRAHQLSHGESRKIFLSRLLLRSPKLLILDDPYTGLDEVTRQHLHNALEQLLRSQQVVILFITSRDEDIPTAVNHVLQVADRQVISQGPRFAHRPSKKPAPHSFPENNSSLKESTALARIVDQYTTALKHSFPSNPQPIVQMEDVSIAYDGVDILKNISWTVLPGQRWALTGANGAGKSTLLSLILADHPQAYRNSINLFGRRRGSGESIWEIKQRIGWVSPELQIFYDQAIPCHNVISSGFFDSIGLYHTCTQQQMDALQNWAQVFNIQHLLEQPFDVLSTGQQRLVLLCRALVKNPSLLILDEPCQGLDDTQRMAFIDRIDQICNHVPVTMIYVTHFREELPACITHRLRLEGGTIQNRT